MCKVYFAGTEDFNYALMAKLGGAKYCLMTAYPFVRKGAVSECAIASYLLSFCKGVILDSGLFTLMFGADKGKKSEAFILDWTENLIEFIRNNPIQITPVEVDCQKVLSPEKAWELRTLMKNRLGEQEFINVFHYEDGKKGLDRLIEFSSYIAISVPEIRQIRNKVAREEVLKIACYIKNKKPSIKIHLLGCTEEAILRDCYFCTSADSTSWKQFARWGGHKVVVDGKVVKARVKYNHLEGFDAVAMEYAKEERPLPKSKKMHTLLMDGIAQVRNHVKIYSSYCGSQN